MATHSKMPPNLLDGLGHSFLIAVQMVRFQLDGGSAFCNLQRIKALSVLGPLLLTQKEPQPATLQELIDEWPAWDPFVCAFLQPNSLICVQFDRFPSLDCKFCEPIHWSRAEVLLPIFDDV